MTRDAEDQTALILPAWFIRLSGAAITIFLLIFLPWAVWQTRTLMRVEIKMEQFDPETTGRQAFEIQLLKQRVDTLEQRVRGE